MAKRPRLRVGAIDFAKTGRVFWHDRGAGAPAHPHRHDYRAGSASTGVTIEMVSHWRHCGGPPIPVACTPIAGHRGNVGLTFHPDHSVEAHQLQKEVG